MEKRRLYYYRKKIINYIYFDISFPYKKDLEKESFIKSGK